VLAQAAANLGCDIVSMAIDDMLRNDYLFDVALPHIPMR
jgi:hypothetical protein